MELYNPWILASSIATLIISFFFTLNKRSNKKREDIDKCEKLINNELYAKTIKHCKSLIEKDKDPLLYYYLGLAYSKIDKTDLAIENFEKAEELSKNKLKNYFNLYTINDPVFYENYADTLRTAKRFDEAIFYYKKALKKREEEEYIQSITRLLQKIAEVYEIKGNLDEAIDCYEEVLIRLSVPKESPTYKNLIRKIADLYEKKGNTKIANKIRKKIGEEVIIEEKEDEEKEEELPSTTNSPITTTNNPIL
jgi:tetratricopeptide (TPR) repeat protein